MRYSTVSKPMSMDGLNNPSMFPKSANIFSFCTEVNGNQWIPGMVDKIYIRKTQHHDWQNGLPRCKVWDMESLG